MDDGIQFGEVEEAAPERALRPDENRHYAVVAYGNPEADDLPIFVDLDVLADMEDHALSDTSVELGGVLLGGHYEDEQGRPFVVVTDSLRARHYESTKGSFKFTHDTWEAITRERDEFPAELAMVGWYHTHPDWGVFLSGMDMFICDNFFNKKLDVAFVIDPCRGDRGMFQWTGGNDIQDKRHRIRRTGGFFVTASRFRAAELEHYVGELSGEMPVTTSQRAAAGSQLAPVVHLHQPPPPKPSWQDAAVLGSLALQFGLLALIAWQLLGPGSRGAGDPEAIVAALENLDESRQSRHEVELARQRAEAKAEILDQLVSPLRDGDPSAVSRVLDQFDQNEKLLRDVDSRDAKIDELQEQVAAIDRRLRDQATAAGLEQDRLKDAVAGLESRNEKLSASLGKYKSDLTAMRKKYEPEAAGEEEQTSLSVWWYVAGAVLAALVLVAGVWIVGGRGSEPADEPESKEEAQPHDS